MRARGEKVTWTPWVNDRLTPTPRHRGRIAATSPLSRVDTHDYGRTHTHTHQSPVYNGTLVSLKHLTQLTTVICHISLIINKLSSGDTAFWRYLELLIA